MNKFMKAAIEEANLGIDNGHGGPFGSVVVRKGKIVGRGHNTVVHDNDPTSHGEIMAIRDACRNLGTYDLTGCDIYTTSEPCPMCLGAVLWSNIDKVYYGCNQEDADKIGFRDKIFYKMMKKKELGTLNEVDRQECLKVFDKYDHLDNKKIY